MLNLLLQARVQLWPEQNTGSFVFGLVLFLIFFLILLVGGFAYFRKQRPSSAAAKSKYSRYDTLNLCHVFNIVPGNDSTVFC